MERKRVTVGYLDSSAIVSVLSPGRKGDRVAALWSSFDATCTYDLAEVEVPSLIGRQIDRMAWVWAINSLSVISSNSEIRTTAIDLAWLGAPPLVAFHVSAAEAAGVDHFVSDDDVARSWAAMRGLNTVSL